MTSLPVGRLLHAQIIWLCNHAEWWADGTPRGMAECSAYAQYGTSVPVGEALRWPGLLRQHAAGGARPVTRRPGSGRRFRRGEALPTALYERWTSRFGVDILVKSRLNTLTSAISTARNGLAKPMNSLRYLCRRAQRSDPNPR